MDRRRSSDNYTKAAMRIGGPGPLNVLLPTSGRERGRSFSDENDRRAIHADAVLRVETNGHLTKRARENGKSETGIKVDGVNGDRGDLSKTESFEASTRTPDIPIFVKESANNRGESGMVYGHHLYSIATWFRLSGRRNRLVFAICSVMGSINVYGNNLLSLGTGLGINPRETGDIQHGPGRAIHILKLHVSAGGGKHSSEHGWKRASPGQCFYRTIVAISEVRRRLYKRLSNSLRGNCEPQGILRLLQSKATTSGTELQNTGGRMANGIAYARQAVKELRPLRGAALVPRSASLTARLAAAEYLPRAAAAARFQTAGFHLSYPCILSKQWGPP
jgi:hypothetical protein